MTQTYNENVIVDGAQDEVQLTVQGHSTQTEALQEWQESGGSALAKVTEDGRFQSGDMGLSTPDALMEAHRDQGSSLPQRGIHSLGKVASAISNAISWLVSELELVGTAAISSLHTAIRGRLTHSSTGDSSNAELRAGDFETINQSGSSGTPVGAAVGVQGTVDNQANAHLTKASGVVAQIQNASGADIETAAAIEVASPVNNGTIDVLIGLEIPDVNQGTENYAIRTGEGVVHLGDVMDLEQRTVDPANKADVVQFYAKGDKVYAKAPDPDNTVYDLAQGGSSPVMTGATDTTDGASGLVPQPLAGEEGKFLRGDSSWADASLVADLDDLGDVDTTGASNGDVLTFDGTDWAAAAPSGGTLSDGSVTTNKLADDAVTTDKLAHGTADHYLGFDSSGVPVHKSIPWYSPGYIGGTTPNGGKFTSLYYESVSVERDTSIWHGLKSFSNSLYEMPILALHRARGSQSSPAAVQQNDPLAEIGMHGYDGSAFVNRIKIVGAANEDWDSSNQGAKLQFQVGVDGSTGSPGDSLVITGQDVAVTGNLSKGSGTFLIDHPLDPENKDLYHGFVEAPRFDLIYRGQVTLVEGQATVSIDEASNMTDGTFAALTQNPQLWLQNQSGWDAVRGAVQGGTLLIECQNPQSEDVIDWLVVAERADAFIQSLATTDEIGQLIPEHDKPEPDGTETQAISDARSAVDYEVDAVDLIGKRGYARHRQALGIQTPLPTRLVKGTRNK